MLCYKDKKTILKEVKRSIEKATKGKDIVWEETLKKHPELKKILMLMDGILTDQEMADLNYQVEIAGNSERDVAANFLQSKGLIKKNKNHGK